ncbi:MAG: hypothetical protein BAA01_09140 [Bacillus thermozeamaize]|uniref:Prepilin-type N-terminal cleavage/methylation domain-containing protein n=1 Tax=Bacillus thermozeamaize TaxID=230954 RepID=A0A1Y3PIP9_9BACI|nr:MAG: hypothetical protein BAA01_09140 [Bacillus thermozeamaize]
MRRRHVLKDTQARREEKARKRQKGFTLIEMLAVVIILVIVAAIGFVVVNSQIERSRQNTDQANVRTVADAVQRYIMDKSTAPGGIKDLVDGGYLAKGPQDPWNDTGHDDEYTDNDNLNDYITISGSPNVSITSKHGATVTLKGAVPATGGGTGSGK